MNTINKMHQAKKAKKDEFYTRLIDIEHELRHYKKHFKGKTVYCNCDDPRISQFFVYFAERFEVLGLKKLVTTCYKNQDPDIFSPHDSEKAVCLVYEGDKNTNRIVDDEEVLLKPLNGDGDFRSEECISILKDADVVVTNPPFSLFREYIAQLIDYDRKFIVVGHQNAVKYKEIFPLIKENKIWLGYGFKGGAAHFHTDYEDYASAADRKEGMVRVSGVHWFTNLPIDKRNKPMILVKEYNPKDYPNYDNYDAIEVGKTKDIPKDYDGYMGVPITFLDKYNPDQFELLGFTNVNEINKGIRHEGSETGNAVLNGQAKYSRILIRRK